MASRWNAAAGLCLLTAILAPACSHPTAPATHLHVSAPVPGLAASDQYAFRVRTVGTSTWTDAGHFTTNAYVTGLSFERDD